MACKLFPAKDMLKHVVSNNSPLQKKSPTAVLAAALELLDDSFTF
jgi:hypothetical protein